MLIKNIIKGDSATLEWQVDTDITGWKIRVEINDICKNSIKLATANSGGSDDQVQITDAAQGTFLVYIPAGATKCFNDKSFLEIEVDTGNIVGGKPEIITIIKADILFKKQQIDWSNP